MSCCLSINCLSCLTERVVYRPCWKYLPPLHLCYSAVKCPTLECCVILSLARKILRIWPKNPNKSLRSASWASSERLVTRTVVWSSEEVGGGGGGGGRRWGGGGGGGGGEMGRGRDGEGEGAYLCDVLMSTCNVPQLKRFHFLSRN